MTEVKDTVQQSRRLLWRLQIHRVAEVSFALFLILSLTTPSWRYGAFAWWPLFRLPLLAGAPMAAGLFNLLPLLVIAGWLIGRQLDRRAGQETTWLWGRPGVTLSLIGLTVLGLVSLDPTLSRRTFIHAGGIILTWLVYLFLLNERPRLVFPFAVIILIQSAIALMQFVLQKDLGLVFLGELPLNPAFEGITVLWARNQPWLRAYGLTAHPNLLGALLAALLLLMLPAYERWHGWRQLGLTIVLSIGSLGLLVSFSRAAWLALGAGLLAYIPGWLRQRRQASSSLHKKRVLTNFLLFGLPLLLLLAINYDLVLSRFVALDSFVEAQSLNERLHDIRLALQVIEDYPWTGVGLGNYTDFVLTLDENAKRVHNVPLLVTAELGLMGGILWLWLALSPFLPGNDREKQEGTESSFSSTRVAQLAPWIALIVISMFDTMLWWSSNWQTAILFALLAAHLTRNITQNTSEAI